MDNVKPTDPIINEETAMIQAHYDEITKEEIAIQLLLLEIRSFLKKDPTLLRRIIETALEQNFATSAEAVKKINQADLLFKVLSKEERARLKSKGIEPIFLI